MKGISAMQFMGSVSHLLLIAVVAGCAYMMVRSVGNLRIFCGILPKLPDQFAVVPRKAIIGYIVEIVAMLFVIALSISLSYGGFTAVSYDQRSIFLTYAWPRADVKVPLERVSGVSVVKAKGRSARLVVACDGIAHRSVAGLEREEVEAFAGKLNAAREAVQKGAQQ